MKFKPDEIMVEVFPPAQTEGMLTGNTPKGVKVTHLATGISVIEDSARHQWMNRELALTRLWDEVESSLEGFARGLYF